MAISGIHYAELRPSYKHHQLSVHSARSVGKDQPIDPADISESGDQIGQWSIARSGNGGWQGGHFVDNERTISVHEDGKVLCRNRCSHLYQNMQAVWSFSLRNRLGSRNCQNNWTNQWWLFIGRFVDAEVQYVDGQWVLEVLLEKGL